MDTIIKCIEDLRTKLDKYIKENLKEYSTRIIFIDPLLQALGWNVKDPDEVELEYPTIDGKSVDYAPKINRKPVLFIEAKPLNDPLTDVKSITQVVGYAANAGVEWCILTNGVTYKVYHSTEKAEAPDKLLFEVSIDPIETEGITIQQIAEQFARFSRDAMAKGLLDEIGEQIFITGKIRKALDKLLPIQRSDFEGIFEAMHDLHVTVRLLDPPLHEFVPHDDKEQEEMAKVMNIDVSIVKAKVEALH